MAISKSFFGLRRGSTKSMTFQVLNGQQITKDRVLGGKNPRSDAQMTQRSQFLSAVRFYERSNRNLFRFAFEDKKQQESEYNAFMRLNAKIGPYITKAQGDAVGFPMVAPWLIAKGSLTPIPVVRYEDADHEDAYLDVVLVEDYTGEVPTTVGEVSALLRVACPQVQELDIITIPKITSTEAGSAFVNDFDAEDITMENLWSVSQFIVDSNDERELLPTAGLFCEIHGTSLVMSAYIGSRDTIGASAFILSRNTATGLKVATTTLSLNLQAEAVYEGMRDNAHREQVLAWWGAQSQAILQGSLASPASPEPSVLPVPVAVSGYVEGGSSSIPAQLTIVEGDEMTYVLSFDRDAKATITGSMLNVQKSSGDIVTIDEYTALKWLNNSTLEVRIAVPASATDWRFFNLNTVRIGEFMR